MQNSNTIGRRDFLRLIGFTAVTLAVNPAAAEQPVIEATNDNSNSPFTYLPINYEGTLTGKYVNIITTCMTLDSAKIIYAGTAQRKNNGAEDDFVTRPQDGFVTCPYDKTLITVKSENIFGAPGHKVSIKDINDLTNVLCATKDGQNIYKLVIAETDWINQCTTNPMIVIESVVPIRAVGMNGSKDVVDVVYVANGTTYVWNRKTSGNAVEVSNNEIAVPEGFLPTGDKLDPRGMTERNDDSNKFVVYGNILNAKGNVNGYYKQTVDPESGKSIIERIKIKAAFENAKVVCKK